MDRDRLTRILKFPAWSPQVGVALLVVPVLYLILATAFYQVDFRAYYVAAKAAHAGLDPYANNVGVSEEFNDTHHMQESSRLKYPPTALPLLLPLAYFEYPAAKMVFTGGLYLALVLLLFLLSAERHIAGGYLVLMLVSLPVLVGIERGQIDILIVTGVVLAHVCRRHWTGGLFLALAISLKVLGILLLPYYLVRGERKIVVWTVIFCAAIGVYSTVIFGVDSWHGFVENLNPGPGPAAELPNVEISKTKIAYYWLFGEEGHWLLDGPGIARLSIAQNLFARFEAGMYVFAALLIGLYLAATRHVANERLVFATYLLVILSGNHTLWLMGLVWYIPVACEMLAWCGARFVPSLLVILPFFLPPFVRSGEYSLAYAVALLVALFHLRTRIRHENRGDPAP